MEEKNIIQAIKEKEDQALRNIEQARIENAKAIEIAQQKAIQDKELILGNFKSKMNSIAQDLANELEKIKNESKADLKKKITELEQGVERNQKKALEFIINKLVRN